jgi:uncharacterized membrane protein YsdA (DUF1294 family)
VLGRVSDDGPEVSLAVSLSRHASIFRSKRSMLSTGALAADRQVHISCYLHYLSEQHLPCTDKLSQHVRPTHNCLKMPPNRPKPRRRPWTFATIAGIVSLVFPTCSLVRLYASTHSLIPVAWTCVASSITFLYYGYDKMQARNNEWRVKEMTLHALAVVGGWPGALAGMHYFQHKTKKTRFQIVFWVTVLAWQGVWWTFWTGGLQLD